MINCQHCYGYGYIELCDQNGAISGSNCARCLGMGFYRESDFEDIFTQSALSAKEALERAAEAAIRYSLKPLPK